MSLPKSFKKKKVALKDLSFANCLHIVSFLYCSRCPVVSARKPFCSRKTCGNISETFITWRQREPLLASKRLLRPLWNVQTTRALFAGGRFTTRTTWPTIWSSATLVWKRTSVLTPAVVAPSPRSSHWSSMCATASAAAGRTTKTTWPVRCVVSGWVQEQN